MASPLEQAKRAYQNALKQKRRIDKKNSKPLKQVQKRKAERQGREATQAARPKTQMIRRSTNRLKRSGAARGVAGFTKGFASGFSLVPVKEDTTGAFNGLTAQQRQRNPLLNKAVQQRVAAVRRERDRVIDNSKEGKTGKTAGYAAGTIAGAILSAPITSAAAGKIMATKGMRKLTASLGRKLGHAATEKAAASSLKSAMLRKGLSRAAQHEGLSALGNTQRMAHNAVKGAIKNTVQDVIYDTTVGAAKDTSAFVEQGNNPIEQPKKYAKYMLENAGQNLVLGAIGNAVAPALAHMTKSGKYYRTVRQFDDIPNAQGRYSHRIVNEPVPARSMKQAEAMADKDYLKYIRENGIKGKSVAQAAREEGRSILDVITDNYTPQIRALAEASKKAAKSTAKEAVNEATEEATEKATKKVAKKAKKQDELSQILAEKRKAKEQANVSAENVAKQAAPEEGVESAAKSAPTGASRFKAVQNNEKVNNIGLSDRLENSRIAGKKLANGKATFNENDIKAVAENGTNAYQPRVPEYAVGERWGTKYIKESPTNITDLSPVGRAKTVSSWLRKNGKPGERDIISYAKKHNMEPSDVVTYVQDQIAKEQNYPKMTAAQQQEWLNERRAQNTATPTVTPTGSIPVNAQKIQTKQGTGIGVAREAGDTAETVAKQAEYTSKMGNATSEDDIKAGYSKMPNEGGGFVKPNRVRSNKDSQAVNTVVGRMEKKGYGNIAKDVGEWLDETGESKKLTESNDQLAKDAAAHIDEFGQRQVATNIRLNVEAGRGMSAEEVAQAGILQDIWAEEAEEAFRLGDMKKYNLIENDIANLSATMINGANTAGADLQAWKALKAATPDGRVRSVRMMVARLKKDKGIKDLKPDPELLRMLKNATEESDIEKVQQAIAIDIWNQVPVSLNEKIGAVRYICMLLNPKTHARNIMGNAAFVPVRGVRDTIEAGWQYAMQGKLKKLGVDRTKGIVNPLSGRYKGNINGAHQEWDSRKPQFYSNNVKYSKGVGTGRPQDATKPLGKVVGGLSDFTGKTLNAEDEVFAAPAYEKAFANFLTTRKIDYSKATKEQIEEASKFAYDEALEATYRAKNELADLINKVRAKANIPWKGSSVAKKAEKLTGIAADTIAPFVNTPMNIMKTGAWDLNPAQVLRGAYNMKFAKTGQQALDGIRELSNGLTGTALFALGVWAARNKIATASINNDDQGYYDRDKGYQDYSITIGKKTFKAEELLDDLSVGKDLYDRLPDSPINLSMDWAMPEGVPFFMGVEAQKVLDQGFSEDETDPESAIDYLERLVTFALSTAKILDPIFDTSMVSSLSTVLDTSDAKKNGISPEAQFALNLTDSRLGQYTPTMMSQASRITASARHNTTATRQGIAGWGESFVRKQLDKVPYVSGKVNPNKSNAFGQDVKGKSNATDYALSTVENFLSPSNVRVIRETDVDKEAQRLIDRGQPIADVAPQTSYIGQMPTGFDGKKFKLSTKDLETFNRIRGQKNLKSLSRLIKTTEYQNASDEEKAAMYKKVYDENTQEAKKEFLATKGFSLKQQEEVLQKEKEAKMTPEEREAKKEREKEEKEKWEERVKKMKKVGINEYQYKRIYDNVGRVKANKGTSWGSTGMYVARTMAAIEGGVTEYDQAKAATSASKETWDKALKLREAGFRSAHIKDLILDDKTRDSLKGTTKKGEPSQYIDNRKLMLYVQKLKVPKRQKWAIYEINKQDRYNKYPNPF